MSRAFLAFYCTEKPDLLQRLITLVDGSRFSHVELALYNPETKDYTCYSSSHWDNGVRKKVIPLDSGRWTLIPVEVDVQRLEKLYETYKGAKYDYFGLISTKIHKLKSSKNRWFCSEFCAEALGIKKPSTFGVKRLYEYFTKGKN